MVQFLEKDLNMNTELFAEAGDTVGVAGDRLAQDFSKIAKGAGEALSPTQQQTEEQKDDMVSGAHG